MTKQIFIILRPRGCLRFDEFAGKDVAILLKTEDSQGLPGRQCCGDCRPLLQSGQVYQRFFRPRYFL